MPETSGIFRLTNNLPDYKYIGYSSQIETCTKDYIKWCEHGKHPNKAIQEAFDKGGAFKVEILEAIEKASRKQLDERKRYWREQPAANPPDGKRKKKAEPEPEADTEDAERDAKVMEAVRSGKSIHEAAVMFGVSDRTICRIKRKYAEDRQD